MHTARIIRLGGIRQERHAADCHEAKTILGMKKSGPTTVYVPRRVQNSQTEVAVRVYCDMETEGGGWTVCIRT